VQWFRLIFGKKEEVSIGFHFGNAMMLKASQHLGFSLKEFDMLRMVASENFQDFGDIVVFAERPDGTIAHFIRFAETAAAQLIHHPVASFQQQFGMTALAEQLSVAILGIRAAGINAKAHPDLLIMGWHMW
jgi:hypothetical protein